MFFKVTNKISEVTCENILKIVKGYTNIKYFDHSIFPYETSTYCLTKHSHLTEKSSLKQNSEIIEVVRYINQVRLCYVA